MAKDVINFEVPDDFHGGLLTEGVYDEYGDYTMTKTCFEYLASYILREINIKNFMADYKLLYDVSKGFKKSVYRELKKLLTIIWYSIEGNKYTRAFYDSENFVVFYHNRYVPGTGSIGRLTVKSLEFEEYCEVVWCGGFSAYNSTNNKIF